MRYLSSRESKRHTMSLPERSGRSPSVSDWCRSPGDVPGQSGTHLWCFPAIRQRMASSMAEGRIAGSAVSTARPALGHSIGAMAGGNDRAIAHRSLPRPTQVAIRSLDARSRARSHRASIRPLAFCLDGGAVPATLGVHTTKTDPTGLRAGSQGCPSLAEPGVSGHPNVRKTAAGHNILG